MNALPLGLGSWQDCFFYRLVQCVHVVSEP